MDRRDYLETKFGGKEGAIRAYAPVLERAEAAGLAIDFAAIKRTPNTLDAHRLLHWAGIEGCQDRMAMALFHAYFNEGRDIGDHEVLADLADSLSLDGAMIQRLLASEADRDAIRARDAQFREMGISGVPTFIVGGQHAVPGCQPADLWVKVIDDLTAAAS
jgi:predicted DsbA family dithiol-disulfide isomerase